jgi:glycosyltransferase involved in cell wall biosynthesis
MDIRIAMISVITPVHNGARFIESCIASVISQQCTDVEHIIVDGASTDATVSVVRDYAKKFPHIRWISEPDRGQSEAMNKGIALARGEVIGILNVDDFYEPNLLNRIAALLKTANEPALVVGNCNVWNDDGELLYVARPSRLKLQQLLVGPRVNLYPVNPSQYFYHRSLHDRVGGFDVDDHYAMDLDFLIRAVQVAHVRYFDEIWGNFRLIQGTKTQLDQQSSGNCARYSAILAKYRKLLPWHLRRFFWIYTVGQAALFLARYAKRRLTEPEGKMVP